MEDQICGSNINSNSFIFLPKSNFHKFFFFKYVIPATNSQTTVYLIETNVLFFQFESFWLRIQFDQNIYAKTKKPIYSFLKIVVSKQKIIKDHSF